MKVLACQLMESPPISTPETKVTHMKGKVMNDVHFFITSMAKGFIVARALTKSQTARKTMNSGTTTLISAGTVLLATILCLNCFLQFSENLIVCLR